MISVEKVREILEFRVTRILEIALSFNYLRNCSIISRNDLQKWSTNVRVNKMKSVNKLNSYIIPDFFIVIKI